MIFTVDFNTVPLHRWLRLTSSGGCMKTVIGARSGPQVAFVGPFGVGKTTAVLTACEGDVVMTEVDRSRLVQKSGRHLKVTTTVGLEIGQWRAPDGETVCVVGTPGQERFDVVRRSAMPRSQAVVLWLYGDHKQAIEDASLWLEFILAEVPSRKVVVALTRMREDSHQLVKFRQAVAAYDAEIPILLADPRDRESVVRVLESALRRAKAPKRVKVANS
jgi:uncharacterized protein